MTIDTIKSGLNLKVDVSDEFYLMSWLFGEQAITSNIPKYEGAFCFYIEPPYTSKEILEKFKKTFPCLKLTTINYKLNKKVRQEILSNKDSVVKLFEYHGNCVNIDITTLDEALINSVSEFCSAHKASSKTAAKSVHMLMDDGQQLTVSQTGAFYRALCKENYTPEVLKKYEAIGANFVRENPKGRITLLSGPPGTGKTSLVRALPDLCNKAQYVYLSTELAGCLTKPNFIPVIKKFAEEHKDDAIVFIIEDADTCVLKRTAQGSNKDLVSGMLNWSDGILGEMFNIHFVLTTNVTQVDMDKAITRKGRMFDHIEIDALSAECATNLLHKLNPSMQDFTFKKNTTLGDVYYQAANDNNEQEAAE